MATNFKISNNAGRFLALTKEGTGGVVSIISAYTYPRQVPDVPYGISLNTSPVVPANAPAKAFVPSATNGGDSLGPSWRGASEPFDDSSWSSGSLGAGISDLATWLTAPPPSSPPSTLGSNLDSITFRDPTPLSSTSRFARIAITR